jgi:cytochrome c peroxidase
MEIIAFLLGIGSVIAVAMVVYIFSVNKRINKNEQLLNEHQTQFDSINREINREIENVNSMINQHVDELYRTLDSRFDKFENKLNNKK